MEQIGTISACIAGDPRYATRVNVLYEVRGDWARVERWESSAAGGMDGDGRANPMTLRHWITVDPRRCGGLIELDARDVVKAIKAILDATVRRYGKPTKNFSWPGVGQGLGLATVRRAIAAARDGANS